MRTQENKQNKRIIKEWIKPQLFFLDKNKTGSGPIPGTTETTGSIPSTG